MDLRLAMFALTSCALVWDDAAGAVTDAAEFDTGGRDAIVGLEELIGVVFISERERAAFRTGVPSSVVVCKISKIELWGYQRSRI